MLALRRNPWTEVWKDLDGWFDSPITKWSPAADISENKEAITIDMELPGVSSKDVDVSLNDNILTIKGEKIHERKGKEKEFHKLERFQGSFSRSFTIPKSVDVSSISADYKNGVLSINLPKRAEVVPKQIEVKIKES